VLKLIILFSFLIFDFYQNAFADLEVAFFQDRDSNGNIISLEDGGQFYHIAIKTEDGWIHALPYFGVTLFHDLSSIHPPLALILKNPDLPPLTRKEYKPYLKIPFDSEFTWSDPKKTYCAKLVGNLLDIAPLPMKNTEIKDQYNPALQDQNYTVKLKDSYGLSPDDLYKILTRERGFKIQEWKCNAIL
jgi:hypothetical protein